MPKLNSERVTVKYGNDELTIELNGLNTFEDMVALAASIKPQTKLDIKLSKVPEDNYMKFDCFTEKEYGLLNFCDALKAICTQYREAIVPSTTQQAIMFSQLLGGKNHEFMIPNIDISDFETYSKLSAFEGFVEKLFSYGLYSRLGFENIYTYDADGTILVLKDLRKFFSGEAYDKSNPPTETL